MVTDRGKAAGVFSASDEIGALLALLDEVLDEAPDGRGNVMAHDPAMRRKVAVVQVGFEALRALEVRARLGAGFERANHARLSLDGVGTLDVQRGKDTRNTRNKGYRDELKAFPKINKGRPQETSDANDPSPGNAALKWVVEIKRTELRIAVGHLVTEALAYQALPMVDERPGDNEVPVGGTCARLARRVLLSGLHEHTEETTKLRDRLALLLSSKSQAP